MGKDKREKGGKDRKQKELGGSSGGGGGEVPRVRMRATGELQLELPGRNRRRAFCGLGEDGFIYYYKDAKSFAARSKGDPQNFWGARGRLDAAFGHEVSREDPVSSVKRGFAFSLTPLPAAGAAQQQAGQSPDPGKKIILRAESRVARKEWLDAIEDIQDPDGAGERHTIVPDSLQAAETNTKRRNKDAREGAKTTSADRRGGSTKEERGGSTGALSRSKSTSAATLFSSELVEISSLEARARELLAEADGLEKDMFEERRILNMSAAEQLQQALEKIEADPHTARSDLQPTIARLTKQFVSIREAAEALDAQLTASLSEVEQRRKHIVNELVATERSYVQVGHVWFRRDHFTPNTQSLVLDDAR
jgi:hypothetical protein